MQANRSPKLFSRSPSAKPKNLQVKNGTGGQVSKDVAQVGNGDQKYRPIFRRSFSSENETLPGIDRAMDRGMDKAMDRAQLPQFSAASSQQQRRLILQSTVTISQGNTTRKRIIRLFQDNLTILKTIGDKTTIMTSQSISVVRHINLADMWLTKNCDRVVDKKRSFLIGWPFHCITVTFNDEQEMEQWYSTLDGFVKYQKKRQESPEALVRVLNADKSAVPQWVEVMIKNTDNTKVLMSKCVDCWHLKENIQKFELCAIGLKQTLTTLYDYECPLIVYRFIKSQKLAHRKREVKEDEINNADSSKLANHCHFVFRLKGETEPRHKIWKQLKLSAIGKSKSEDRQDKLPVISCAVFGQPLRDLYSSELTPPHRIMVLLEVLYDEGVNTEGIMRQPANKTLMMEYRSRMDAGEVIRPEDTMAAALLKEFLRNLPESLFLESLYNEWLACADITNDNERLEAVRKLYSQLPDCNRHMLSHIFCVFHQIVLNHSVNKMDADNLAICTALSLLYSKTDVSSDAVKKVIVVIRFLLDKVSEVFGDDCLTLFNKRRRLQAQDTLSTDDSFEMSLDDSGMVSDENSIQPDNQNQLHQLPTGGNASSSVISSAQAEGRELGVESTQRVTKDHQFQTICKTFVPDRRHLPFLDDDDDDDDDISDLSDKASIEYDRTGRYYVAANKTETAAKYLSHSHGSYIYDTDWPKAVGMTSVAAKATSHSVPIIKVSHSADRLDNSTQATVNNPEPNEYYYFTGMSPVNSNLLTTPARSNREKLIKQKSISNSTEDCIKGGDDIKWFVGGEQLSIPADNDVVNYPKENNSGFTSRPSSFEQRNDLHQLTSESQKDALLNQIQIAKRQQNYDTVSVTGLTSNSIRQMPSNVGDNFNTDDCTRLVGLSSHYGNKIERENDTRYSTKSSENMSPRVEQKQQTVMHISSEPHALEATTKNRYKTISHHHKPINNKEAADDRIRNTSTVPNERSTNSRIKNFDEMYNRGVIIDQNISDRNRMQHQRIYNERVFVEDYVRNENNNMYNGRDQLDNDRIRTQHFDGNKQWSNVDSKSNSRVHVDDVFNHDRFYNSNQSNSDRSSNNKHYNSDEGLGDHDRKINEKLLKDDYDVKKMQGSFENLYVDNNWHQTNITHHQKLDNKMYQLSSNQSSRNDGWKSSNDSVAAVDGADSQVKHAKRSKLKFKADEKNLKQSKLSNGVWVTKVDVSYAE